MMPRFSALSATLALLAVAAPAAAQTTIDFDDVAAPCVFASTSPLTAGYAGLGVTFGGGGAILDQCGNFGLGARSGTQFLAFNTDNYAVGPAVLTFDGLAGSVSVFAGSGASSQFLLQAFDGSGGLLGTVGVFAQGGTWNELAFTSSAGIGSVVLSSTSSTWVADDLAFSVGAVTAVPEPSTLALTVIGLGVVGVVGRRRARGS